MVCAELEFARTVLLDWFQNGCLLAHVKRATPQNTVFEMSLMSVVVLSNVPVATSYQVDTF